MSENCPSEPEKLHCLDITQINEAILCETASSHKQARWLHLARSGGQSHHVIWFILLTRRACHIIKQFIRIYDNI